MDIPNDGSGVSLASWACCCCSSKSFTREDGDGKKVPRPPPCPRFPPRLALPLPRLYPRLGPRLRLPPPPLPSEKDDDVPPPIIACVSARLTEGSKPSCASPAPLSAPASPNSVPTCRSGSERLIGSWRRILRLAPLLLPLRSPALLFGPPPAPQISWAPLGPSSE